MHASAAPPRVTMRATRRPARVISSMARVSGRVSGWCLRMPRVSAVRISGHGPGSGAGRRKRPLSARHQLSTDGVGESSSRRLPSSRARSMISSRECTRGAPGGLWAASCSSSSATVAGGGSGTSRAERAPTTTRARPREAANQAARRSASGAPLSSRAASNRLAQRAALSRSGTIRRAASELPASTSTSRASRWLPTQSSGSDAAP